MSFNLFHFASPVWLYALLFVPFLWLLSWFRAAKAARSQSLESFADAHLLPHLLVTDRTGEKRRSVALTICSLAWTLGTMALANPQWDFHLVRTFQPDRSLVVVLDLSNSMNETDLKPSRLEVAKQKIQDIIDESRGVQVGLVAFAEDAHMVTPITDDKRALRGLLPSLATDLVYVQGRRIAPALKLAKEMLDSMPGAKKSILVLSAGDFEDPSAVSLATTFARDGIDIDVMAFGNDSVLQEFSRLGHGTYSAANATIQSIGSLKNSLISRTAIGATPSAGESVEDWEPRFYIFLVPLMILLLPLFRRTKLNAGLALLALIFCSPVRAQASPTDFLFKNKATQGRELLESKKYEEAAEKFEDPYRRGVAEYRAGNFAKAEASFAASKRPEVALDATYNLGNALAKQEKLSEAADAYRAVLKQSPDHERAKENLKLVMDLLKQKNESPKNQDSKTQASKGPEATGQDPKNQNAKDQNAKDQSAKDEESKNDQNAKGQKNSAKKPESMGERKNEEVSQQQKAAQPAGPSGEPQKPADGKEVARAASAPSQKDIDADQWLNRIQSRPENFLKNQFMIESTRSRKGAKK
jgi:Ca-activated chloride channel homolog